MEANALGLPQRLRKRNRRNYCVVRQDDRAGQLLAGNRLNEDNDKD